MTVIDVIGAVEHPVSAREDLCVCVCVCVCVCDPREDVDEGESKGAG